MANKISKEALERFKELHPERFAELQVQAERDWNKPTTRQTIGHTPTTTLQPNLQPDWFKRGLSLEEALEETRAKLGDRHFLITTKHHRYFEGGFTEEGAVSKLNRHPSYLGEEIVSIEEYK